MKYSLAGLGLAVGLSIAIGLWLLFSAPQNIDPVSSREKTPALREAATEVDIESGRTSLAALLARGESRECTLFFDSGTFQGEGTAFVTSEALRGDAFYELSGNEQAVSSIVMYQGQVHQWYTTPESTIGVTYPLSAVTNVNAEISSDYPGILPNDLVRYSCWSWEDGETALFVPPPFIDFVSVLE